MLRKKGIGLWHSARRAKWLRELIKRDAASMRLDGGVRASAVEVLVQLRRQSRIDGVHTIQGLKDWWSSIWESEVLQVAKSDAKDVEMLMFRERLRPVSMSFTV